MSTVSTRHQVRQVESAPAQSGGSEVGAVIAAGLLLMLGAAARGIYHAISEGKQAARELPAHAALPPDEREKLDALLDLRSAPLPLESVGVLKAQARAVLDAGAALEVKQRRLEFQRTLTSARREALASNLALCCRRAALEMGFTPAGALAAAHRGLPLRLAAADEAGRAFISEIRESPGGGVTLETEVAGVTDGSCSNLIERYEKLLEEYGVCSEAPRRRPTGGILETQAARAFAGSRLRVQGESERKAQTSPRRRGAEGAKARQKG